MTTGDTGSTRLDGSESVNRQPSTVDGVLVIDKPSGITSHDVINRIRRIFGMKRVGHTGTLDPLASGVLVICLGQATRIAEYLTAESKEYVAGITFGIRTDSQDSSGVVSRETDSSHITLQMLESALAGFRGCITQIPPMVSALHHEGKRLYELARKGVEVKREARPVEISRLKVTAFEAGVHPRATLEVECSTGTYIRTLAADIGDALQVGAMMHALHRTRVGRFTILDSVTIVELEKLRTHDKLYTVTKSIPEALDGWPAITVSNAQVADVCHGRAIVCPSLKPGIHLILDGEGVAVALAERREGDALAPVKVLRKPS